MLWTSVVLSHWDARDMEETAVSWPMTVTVKSLSDGDLFPMPPVRAHSETPGLESAGTPDNMVVLECW